MYRLNPDGTGFETVHPFSNTDPSAPNGGFLLGSDGFFYGTSGGGGAADAGTVYRFDPANGVTVLHAFTGTDGNGPGVLIEGEDHAFYGSAFSGGAGATPSGTVFRVDALGRSPCSTPSTCRMEPVRAASPSRRMGRSLDRRSTAARGRVRFSTSTRA